MAFVCLCRYDIANVDCVGGRWPILLLYGEGATLEHQNTLSGTGPGGVRAQLRHLTLTSSSGWRVITNVSVGSGVAGCWNWCVPTVCEKE